MWVRADLRQRWRSWIVLGLLAGVAFGVAAAAVAGARRTAEAVPRYVRANGSLDAVVLANSPAFDAQVRAAVARLPEVREVYPLAITLAIEVTRPRGLQFTTIPTTANSLNTGVVVDGRAPDPRRADEAVVDETTHRRFGLGIGSTIVVRQSISPEQAAAAPPGLVPAGVDLNYTARLRVVGISKAVSSDADWTPSSGFWRKYGPRTPAFINMFASLRRGDDDFGRFQADVQRVAHQTINVERAGDILGTRKAQSVTGVEEDGLLIFALAALVGGAVLVGQALVRAVTAGAADLPTWRAIGADRRIVVRAMALPALITALVGGVTGVAVAIAISSRFPIGVARRYELDLGTHADWPVLAGAAVALVVLVLGAAWLAAEWRIARREDDGRARPGLADVAARLGLPPAFTVGSRLAVERGRGHRAVPVRSALVGAVVGVIGVVGCLTFRAGIDDAVSTPARSGVVWNFSAASDTGSLTPPVERDLVTPSAVGAAIRATWNRAVPIDGVPTPVFGISALKGSMPLVVVDGRAPRTTSEIAFAPSTQHQLGLEIGDRVSVGPARRRMRVVGTALLPSTSHTDYDQSGWITEAGMRAAFGSTQVPPEALEDYVLLRWAKGADAAAAQRKLDTIANRHDLYSLPAALPTAVVDLGRLRTLPLVLGVFFALLAAATVAHALVTTVRRRRHDLAVLRTIGFTRGQARLAVAWQATLIAAVGLLVGIPLGIAAGRLVWRSIADNFPIDYVAPLAVVALLVAVPVVLAVANALAAGPAWAAARIRPAEVLRTE